MRLLLVLFIVTSCTNIDNAPDLILTNGKVWTASDAGTFEEAVAIKDNKILRVGTSKEIARLAAEGKTVVVDLKGKLVTPGFNDAHIHFLGGSMGLLEIDLNAAKSAGDVSAMTLAWASQHPEKPWITGRGWAYTIFENGLPDARALVALDTMKRPVLLTAYDGHSAWANKSALRIAAVDANTRFDGYGRIVLDNKKQPTGALLEDVMSLVSKLVPEPTREDKLNALRLGCKKAAELGITSIQNASGDAGELSLYEELNRNGELTLRYRGCFSIDKDATAGYIDTVTQIRDRIGFRDARLKADAVKFMLDGVIESHTAAMLDPYSDLSHDEKGSLSMPSGTYRSLVQQLDARGFHLYTHAIGDAAVRETLDAYELAAKQNGPRDRRHRIEHIETVSPADIPRFKTLGVWASMEPIHADPGTGAVWAKAAGPERQRYAWAWKSMLNEGVSLVFSSDWPACIDLDPIHGIHIAVNRRTPDGYPEGGFVPEQAIDVAHAMMAYTKAGAVSSFEENIKGEIKAGQLADLAVFSQDLFTIPSMDIAKTKVVMTVFDGKIAYSRE